jgi:Tfp pilus assembly protein FimT
MWRRKNDTGLSIFELLTMIAIVAILVIVAVPSFIYFQQLNRINTLAQNLYYNLQYARTEAIKRNSSIYVTFSNGSNWCYGINAGSACTCATPANCNLGATTSNNTQATLSSSGLVSNSIIFEPNHGGSNTQATVSYTVTGGTQAVSVQVGLSGSVQTCSNNVSGYQACS